VPPGTEGAISLEGTLAALLGATLLPLHASASMLIPPNAILLSTISAFLATFAESWIGAAMQEKKGFEFMTNEFVNFVNTVIGAAFAIVLGMILLQFFGSAKKCIELSNGFMNVSFIPNCTRASSFHFLTLECETLENAYKIYTWR